MATTKVVKKYELEKVLTRSALNKKINGVMIPIWKDYDALVLKFKPRFVYYTTCDPRSSKGPYLHTKRRGLLVLIEGRCFFIYKDKTRFRSISLNASHKAMMIDIPAKTGYLIRNPYAREARFIVIADYPWKKGEQETQVPDFSGYFCKKRRIRAGHS